LDSHTVDISCWAKAPRKPNNAVMLKISFFILIFFDDKRVNRWGLWQYKQVVGSVNVYFPCKFTLKSGK